MHEAIQIINNESLHVFLNPNVPNAIDGKGCFDMLHLLNEKTNKNMQAGMFILHEYGLDIGQINQFEKAQVDSKDVF
tara:strand:+ start:470 stop:700 length:231 start_codon:yes stop_codon:yes gene_type:complete